MSSGIVFPSRRPSRTKIVATVGPASESEEMLGRLLDAGVDVFRINMAHGKTDRAQQLLDRIRKVSGEQGVPVAVLVDLAGPKIRLGEIPGGAYPCQTGTLIRFLRGEKTSEPNTFTSTYASLADDLKLGNRVMLADGTVILKVVQKETDSVTCEVVQGGVVRSRQGINLPGVNLSVKTIQPADIENAKWAVKAGVDFLGMSFVRSASDIHELRKILVETHDGKPEEVPHIIAKIEKPEALIQLEEIVHAADGIMVARGDLGVEVDIAQVAVTQKRILETCSRHCKPVIVATQMLESMHHQTVPTRAEATDVANAILDGTDACMLSGETAVGEYPLEAVNMMHRIAMETEQLLKVGNLRTEFGRLLKIFSGEFEKQHGTAVSRIPHHIDGVTEAVCEHAVRLADQIEASLLLVTSISGKTALGLSKKRSFTLSIGTSTSETALRRMCLYWGIIPLRDIPERPKEKLTALVEAGKAAGYLLRGNRVVLISGLRSTDTTRNVIYVHVVD
ncbi:MAG: pyruvate kinase [Planctomycetaceae bacterium]|nr:pyruvate kinase [Planctomycetaceae bacterium]